MTNTLDDTRLRDTVEIKLKVRIPGSHADRYSLAIRSAVAIRLAVDDAAKIWMKSASGLWIEVVERRRVQRAEDARQADLYTRVQKAVDR